MHTIREDNGVVLHIESNTAEGLVEALENFDSMVKNEMARVDEKLVADRIQQSFDTGGCFTRNPSCFTHLDRIHIASHWIASESIQRYQINCGISGLQSESVTIVGQTITYPMLADYLLLMPGDLEILKESVTDVVRTFCSLAEQLNYPIYKSQGVPRSLISIQSSEAVWLASNEAWQATIHDENMNNEETPDLICLGMNIGEPESSDFIEEYKWFTAAKPGSEKFI